MCIKYMLLYEITFESSLFTFWQIFLQFYHCLQLNQKLKPALRNLTFNSVNYSKTIIIRVHDL